MLPSLEGRGWGWVDERSEALRAQDFRPPSADPPPTPPLQGGEKRKNPGGFHRRGRVFPRGQGTCQASRPTIWIGWAMLK